MITLDEARHKAAAWNARDLDASMTHFADDMTFSSPTVVARWGHTYGWLRENFAIGVKAPAPRFELIDVLLGVDPMRRQQPRSIP
jgi:hypothetical protein